MGKAKQILISTRLVHQDYMDGNDNFLDTPRYKFVNQKIDEERESFLKDYIEFIMSSKIVADTTKIWIRSPYPTVASAIHDYNRTLPKEQKRINIDTAESNRTNNTNLLLEYFTDDMLDNVAKGIACDLEYYYDLLDIAIANKGQKNKMLDNLMLKLPNKIEIQKDLSEDEFSEFVGMIAPYFKKHIRYLETNIPEKGVGYLYYLISSRKLKGEHKERYSLLKEMLE